MLRTVGNILNERQRKGPPSSSSFQSAKRDRLNKGTKIRASGLFRETRSHAPQYGRAEVCKECSYSTDGLGLFMRYCKTALNYSVLGFINDSLAEWRAVIKAAQAEADGLREGAARWRPPL